VIAESCAEKESVVDFPMAHRTNIVFVGDNRTNPNWGRGASIALRELLSTVFDINGSVMGECFDLSLTNAGFVGPMVLPNYYHLFRHIWNRRHKGPFSWFIRLQQLLGAKDFVVEDPDESVDTLIANRDRYPGLGQIYYDIAASDAMVVDCDGDIVLSTPPRRSTLFLLAMIELGLRLGKPVCVVNTMISDCPKSGRNIKTLQDLRKLFAQCKCVILRDPESLEYVRQEIPEIRSDFVPDSLFAWYIRYARCRQFLPQDGDFLLPFPEKESYWGKLDFSNPYICIGGGALASSDPQRSISCYCQLVNAVKHLGLAVYLTENDSPDHFLHQVAKETGVGVIPVNAPILLCGAVLANARLFISGRYHPSIFSSLGGTPCIFLESHAHKMASLARVLEYDSGREFSGFPDSSEIDEILSMAKRYLDRGESLRKQIKEVAKRRYDEVTQLPGRLIEELKRDVNEKIGLQSNKES